MAKEAALAAGTDRRAGVYLTAIEVEGFRGIGPQSVLSVDPGPGLTLVVGRNGSGKSSFSEALEMVLLGTNQRWENRVRVWRDGWQNLHHRHSRVAAKFTVDGRRQPLEVARVWGDGDGVDASRLIVDGKPATLDTLGWARALAGHPPLLSHNELEHALDREQSKLYDALAGILGLADLAEAQKVLRDARLEREHTAKEARDALPALRGLLERTADERATAVLAALASRTWDLDAVASTVDGTAVSDERSVLRKLRDLAGLPVLDRERLNAAISALREANVAAERLRGTDAGRAHEVASLLEQALEVHAHADGERCPVCGTEGALTYEWRLRARDQVSELRASADAVRKGQAMLTDAMRQARQLVASAPLGLRDGAGAGVDTRVAMELWERWADAGAEDDALALATHLEAHGPPVIAAIADLRRAAATELERLERAWRPAADAILAWLPLGLRARDAERPAARLKDAETWLKDAHNELRDERFRPIAGAVQENWTELRQDSNVTLGELRLVGSAAQRRLSLDVKVDGEDGSALGVMSQGELNCLALSLFLPRAAMPELPFRFVVIDDPVQAMDPAKVAGLATVLSRAARDRQVIVLTHDTRTRRRGAPPRHAGDGDRGGPSRAVRGRAAPRARPGAAVHRRCLRGRDDQGPAPRGAARHPRFLPVRARDGVVGGCDPSPAAGGQDRGAATGCARRADDTDDVARTRAARRRRAQRGCDHVSRARASLGGRGGEGVQPRRAQRQGPGGCGRLHPKR